MSAGLDTRPVTVCDKCLTASCWDGIFMCEASGSAGTVELPVHVLEANRREHPDYWAKQLQAQR